MSDYQSNIEEEEISLPEKAPVLDYKVLIGVVVLVLVAVFVVISLKEKMSSEIYPNIVTLDPQPEEVVVRSEPERIEGGNDLPEGFPTELILEIGIVVEEGYTLDYIENKQLTVTFLSTLSVEENFLAYSNYLTNNAWAVINSFESTELASIYALKHNSDLNFTVNQSEAGGPVYVTLSLVNR